ncbi:MAG: right-handed parallel beta-helix repeat-containing protein [Candidatus Zixiibacteriota bacterium]|jgi:hypothetical protein
MKLRFLYICLALALLVGLSFGDTDFGQSNIGTDTTWNRSGSPYYVHGDVAILNGATLTIQAGVEVKFYEVKGTGGYEDGAEIVVRNGALVAEGSEGLPVKFTSANSVKKMGDWGAIVVESQNQIILNNAVVEYATNGVRFYRTGVNGSSRSSFEGTVIRNCLNNGVLVDRSHVNLYHVSIENNGENGIKALAGTSTVTVNYSDICSNGMYNFYNGSSSNVDATNCWWGTTYPGRINVWLYDYNDNRSVGEVDYTPFLSQRWKDAGSVATYSMGFVKSIFR